MMAATAPLGQNWGQNLQIHLLLYMYFADFVFLNVISVLFVKYSIHMFAQELSSTRYYQTA